MRRILCALRQGDVHTCIIVSPSVGNQFSAPPCVSAYPVSHNGVSPVSLITRAPHYAGVSPDTMTTLNCVTPPRVQLVWSELPACTVYNACIYIFTSFTTLSVTTMSWSFRTFLNKGNVRMIITLNVWAMGTEIPTMDSCTCFSFLVHCFMNYKTFNPSKAIKASPKRNKVSRILKTSWSAPLRCCQHEHSVVCSQ